MAILKIDIQLLCSKCGGELTVENFPLSHRAIVHPCPVCCKPEEAEAGK